MPRFCRLAIKASAIALSAAGNWGVGTGTGVVEGLTLAIGGDGVSTIGTTLVDFIRLPTPQKVALANPNKNKNPSIVLPMGNPGGLR